MEIGIHPFNLIEHLTLESKVSQELKAFEKKG